MASINLYFPDPNTAKNNKTLPELVPLKIALLILGKLSWRDWVSCSKSSTGLNVLVSNDQLWQPTAELLGLGVEQLSYCRGPVVTSGYKTAVGARVRELKACVATAEPALTRRVKTAEELLAVLNQKTEKTLMGELNEKIQLGQLLNRGMGSHLFLRRMGLSTLQEMRQYATVLQEKYGQREGWDLILNEHLREGDLSEAYAVSYLDRHTLSSSSELDTLFYLPIWEYSKAGDFEGAIALLKKLRSYINLDPEDPRGSYDILICAMSKGKFAVVLKMLAEDLIPKSARISNILVLINKHIEKDMHQAAAFLVQQFAPELEEVSDEFDIYYLLRIYVQLGQNQKAWDLARTHQEKDYHVFEALENAFTFKGLIAEAEKAQALIKK